MPIIKSAKKRVRVAAKQHLKNLRTKRQLHDKVKSLHAALTKKTDTTKPQAEVFSALDTAVKKGIISKNKAARKKRQYNSATKAAGTTKTGVKAVKKAAPAAKKVAAPKKAAKKTVAKKPAAKTSKK